MKILKKIPAFLTLCALASTAVGCSNGPRYYKISWEDYDGTILEVDEKVKEGEIPTFDKANPTREKDAQYEYTFSGWTPEVVAASKDQTYTATYSNTLRKYLISFYDEDGTTLLDSKEVEYGTLPSTDVTPSKQPTVSKEYVFNGWSPALAPVTGETSYTATFREEARKYLVTFYDEDGKTVIDSGLFEYGTVPYTAETPSKDPTIDTSYEFSGWSPALSEVTGETSYTATYSQSVRKYTINFVDDEGNELDSQQVEYDTLPEFKGSTEKEDDELYHYEFVSWDKEIAKVSGDTTYVAKYNKTSLYNSSATSLFEYNGFINKAFTTKKVYQKDVTLRFDNYMDTEWVVTYGAKNDDDASGFQIGNCTNPEYGYSSELTPVESSMCSETNPTSDSFKIALALGGIEDDGTGQYTHKTWSMSAIYSKDYIEGLEDVHLYIKGEEAEGYISMVYQLKGEDEWHVLNRGTDGEESVREAGYVEEGMASTASGTKGTYNYHAYDNYLTYPGYTSKFKDHAVRIGFVYRVFYSAGQNIYLNLGGFVVNAKKSALSFAKMINNEYGDDFTLETNWDHKNHLKILFNSMKQYEDELKDTVPDFNTKHQNVYEYLEAAKTAWGI